MGNPPELDPGRRASEPRRSLRSLDWSRLLRAASVEAALDEVGRWLAPEVQYLRLARRGKPPSDSCEWGRAAEDGSTIERLVEGGDQPATRLVVGLNAGVGDRDELADRACLAIEAWRQARRELGRSEARLSARSGELDVLQALGRAAAEAQTLAELFSTTIAVLHPCVEFDLALVAHRGEGLHESMLFLARPFEEAYLAALELRARRFLGKEGAEAPRAERVPMADFDTARGSERGFREEDLVLLPLIRRGQPTGCLLVAPAANLDERPLRLLYSACNQLSLHMDRILAVRAA